MIFSDMNTTNPVDILQTFCVVVSNARETAEHYARLIDVVDWTVDEGSIRDLTTSNVARFRRAVAATPWGIDVTLIEPLDQAGTYWDFLQNQGQGIHSLVIRVLSEEAFDPAQSWLVDAGIVMTAEETHDTEVRRLFDTREDLGGYHLTIAVGSETATNTENWDLSSLASRPASVPALPFCPLMHFGIVVSNRARFAHRYNQLWGITNWVLADYWTGEGSLDDPEYRGTPSDHGFHCAFAFDYRNFGFELIQPADGESDYRDQFNGRGPSIHHIMCLWVEDQAAFVETLKWLESINVPVVQYSKMDGGLHVYWYLDTRPFLGFQLEAYAMLADFGKNPLPNISVDYSSESLVAVTPSKGARARQPVRVIAQMQVPDEEGGQFREGFAQWGMTGSKDPGCIQYELFQSTTSPGRFALLELWKNPAAYDAHWQQEWQRWGGKDIGAQNPKSQDPAYAGLIGTEFYPLQSYEVPNGRWIPKLSSRKK